MTKHPPMWLSWLDCGCVVECDRNKNDARIYIDQYGKNCKHGDKIDGMAPCGCIFRGTAKDIMIIGIGKRCKFETHELYKKGELWE